MEQAQSSVTRRRWTEGMGVERLNHRARFGYRVRLTGGSASPALLDGPRGRAHTRACDMALETRNTASTGRHARKDPAGSAHISAAALVLSSALVGSGCFGAPAHVGPVSEHFDGSSFHNVPRGGEPDFCDLMEWQLQGGAVVWPESQSAPVKVVPPARVERGLRATQVGHATVLVQLDGLAFLTDPVWSERVGPVSFAGPRRYDPPAIELDDLPRIDAVLISHSHYDHCDAPTLRELERRFAMPIYGGLGTRAMLEDLGIRGGVDLDWWQAARLGSGATIHFVPVQHWSMRGLGDRNQVLWGGFQVRAQTGSFYFGGDTGYGDHFAETRARLGAPDVAILPIGAYLPRWFMAPMHMGPLEAVRAHLELGAARSMGVHWGTFDQADEGRYQAAGELGLALDALRLPRAQFIAARPGDVLEWQPDARRTPGEPLR